MTPEQIAREREIAEALGVVDTSPVDHWLQGAARMANAAVGRIREGQANRAADENATFNRETVASLLGGLGGASTVSTSPVAAALTGSTPADPASARVAAAHSASAAPGQFSGSQQEFVDMLLPAAMEASQRTGIDPRIIVAQAAQETGWGRSAPGNNFFGIKSHGQGGGQTLKTHEYVNGKRVNVSDSFRTFADPSDSVRGYADFILNNPRYKPFMQADGLDAQLEALQASGYATDPNYSRSVGSIARGIALPEQPAQSALESLAVGESMPMPAAAPTQAPVQVAQAGGINPAIIEALSSPYADEGTRRIAGLLLGQHLEQQQQANDPMRALQLEKGRLEIEALRNPRVDPTDTMRNLEWRAAQAGLQPGTPEYTQFMITGGRNDGITVNNMGNIPAGYQLSTDPQTGAQRMEPIPGSPAAMELAEAERMRGEREGQGQRYGRIVLEDIGRVLEAVEGNPNLVAGPLGSMLSNLPGTGAHDVSSMLNTIRANVGFDRLQAMRATSPTGGALGAVSDSENRMLQSTLGALEQSQSPQQFAQNLRRLQNLYTEIVHGPAPSGVSDDEWSKRAWGVQSQDGGNKPLSEMTDAELEAIINGNR